MSIRQYDPLAVARQFLYVREVPQNRGQRVEGIQRWCGGRPGDAWCAYFLTFVLDIAFQGKSPLPRTGSCDVLYAVCKESGWLVKDFLPGDLYFRVRDEHDAHHVGFVANGHPGEGHFMQLSGNTSEDGTSSEGTGVFERDVMQTSDIRFARIP